ncbi:MAG: MFS transporter [Chloroflexota bacterium]
MKSPATATASFSAPAVLGMLLSAYPAGGLSDRLGRRPVGVFSGLLGAGGVLLILFFRGNYFLVITAAGLLGIAFGTFLSANWALATDLVRSGEEGSYLRLCNMASAAGSALARPIGLLIDLFNGVRANSGYLVMLSICLISLLLSSFLLAKQLK